MSLRKARRRGVFHTLVSGQPNPVVITVTTGEAYQTTVQNHLNTLAARSDKSTPYILQFAPGTYNLTTQWTSASGLENVHITSQDPANKATINKGPGWNSEYLLRIWFGSNLRISYLNWVGDHVYDPADDVVHWTDQGIWFASCFDTQVDHCGFTDIGNAAIRHNTATDDPVLGVNSARHVIEDNTFSNCWQVTTTQDSGTTHGGSADWTFQRNTLTNARGSVKFATRTAGATNGNILNNTWVSASKEAIELVSVNDVEIRGNTFAASGFTFIVNAYTNDLANPGFNWGADVVFADNIVNGSQQCFRMSLADYPNGGYSPQGSGLVIDNNTISNITNTNSGQETVRVVNGGVTGVQFTNNDFANITNGTVRYWDPACSSITESGNTLNGSPWP